MSRAELKLGQEAIIEARVFRKGPKPKYIPTALWRWCARQRFSFAGRWENLGEISRAKTLL